MQERLIAVMIDIAYAQEELAESFVAQLSDEVSAFTQSQAASVAAMEREAKVASRDSAIAVYQARGRLASLQAEQALIERLLSDADAST